MSFSLLGLVNAVSPKARGSARVASAVPYGDSPRQRLDVYRPRADGDGLPILVFIYGGSWNMGDRRDYGFAARALAALGYVVVVPDYRVVPEIEYPVFLDDCAAAVRWAGANAGRHGGSANKLALAGHSAGAYNAVMLALDKRYGVSRLVRAVVGLSGPYDFYPFDVEVTKRTFGAVPAPELTQPINLVGPDAPPMFLGTGDADTLVYPRNTVALSRVLREHGVAVEERHYSGTHPTTLLELGSLFGGKSSLMSDMESFLDTRLNA